ncbi:hypothetical protein [Kribbella sp. NPDC055071]
MKETEMDDVREVGAELHRLAEAEPLDPFDPAELITRGKRGRRRRRILTAGGTVAVVAVVAVAASLLPNLSAADSKPAVAAPKPQNPQNPQNPLFEPVPGVPHGEDGADQRLAKAEADRRCALRNPGVKSLLMGGDGMRSGHVAAYDIKVPQNVGACIIPGGDKPTAALITAAAKDPMPKSTADKLRNCSVLAWVDVTDWRVVASDQSTTLGKAALVAISPSGHKVVECELSAAKESDPFDTATTFATLTGLDNGDPVLDPSDKSVRTDMHSAGGGAGGSCTKGICTGYGMIGWGRVKSEAATTVRIRIASSPAYSVPVGEGGWFAYTWFTTASYKINERSKVAAYDKNGKVVKNF